MAWENGTLNQVIGKAYLAEQMTDISKTMKKIKKAYPQTLVLPEVDMMLIYKMS